MKICLAVTLMISSVSSFLSAKDLKPYVAASSNMGTYDFSQWKSEKPEVEGFYPLGISRDGWFAYLNSPTGDTIESTSDSCPKPPCHDGITLINLECSDWSCVRDTPASKEDKCWCPIDSRSKDLSKFQIQPFKQLSRGTFPATIDGKEVSIEIVFKKDLIPSESPRGPKSPGTEVYLLSKGKPKQHIRTFSYDHEMVLEGSVQAVGWIKDPHHSRIAVILGYIAQGDGGKPEVYFVPAGAEL
jgi:hypothetical protein